MNEFSNAQEYLAAMFEADRKDPFFYRRFPGYQFDSELGARPWWPPLCEVWQRRGIPHSYDNTSHWREAWSLLRRLHDQYQAAKLQMMEKTQ